MAGGLLGAPGRTMARRFKKEEIIGVLGEYASGGTVKEVCMRHGISERTFYRWHARWGDPSGSVSLLAMKEENSRLKELLAEAILDIEALKRSTRQKNGRR